MALASKKLACSTPFSISVNQGRGCFLIPKIGFEGSAWATLFCYFSMATGSYFLGRRHFYVPYHVRNILLYLASMLSIFFLVYMQYFNLAGNSLLLLGFIIFVYILEKPKQIRL